jgi:hypothetical protein
MPHTPVYIICSPRPLVGKTLIARLLSEFLLLKNGDVASFDINLKEPSLLEYLPKITETADVIDTSALVTIDNEFTVRGELPPAFARGRVLRIAALPVFLKTYIDRLTFSFTGYLRNEKDSSTELHQWIRKNYFSFRELELNLILQRS